MPFYTYILKSMKDDLKTVKVKLAPDHFQFLQMKLLKIEIVYDFNY